MGCANGKNIEKGQDGSSLDAKPKSKDPERLLDKYTLGKVLGQGAFGVVYSCRRKASSEEFAVKMIDQVETPLAEIKQEVEMLKKLAHPCVVKLHDVYYEKVFVCMVLEFCRGGDMIEGMQLHWKSKGMIPVNVVQNMSKMMFQSIDWLHQHNVVHRDLKGDNYLQDRKDIENGQCRIYLSDFGTVTNLPAGERLRQKCGTKTYWSPEFYLLNYSLKVDIWALGVVIFGMVTGRFPFKGEEDVRVKVVKIPSRCGKEGESFLKATLERNEQKRISAREALQHQFLASIKSTAETMEPFDFKPEVKETGANAGIKERRRELVERLENAQALTQKEGSHTSSVRASHKEVANGFQVYDRHLEKTFMFEWWADSKVREAKFVDDSKVRKVKVEDWEKEVESSLDAIKQMLEAHQISTEKFGQDQAKTFNEFVNEIQGGQARLMLDASKHKNLVRVVDVCLLRVVYKMNGKNLYLTLLHEKYPDGRERKDINQLTGGKKMPFENGMQVAKRLIKERLNMADCDVNFDFMSKECFEDDENSPSYPGVRTVYRKEIFEGTVCTSSQEALNRIGLGAGQKADMTFSHKDASGYTRTLRWLTQDMANHHKVRLSAPTEGAVVSALVHPPIGFDEDELQHYLSAASVDVTRFGKGDVRSLAEFSEELVRGEAALTKKPDGQITRVVDVLVLKLTRKSGEYVVDVGEKGIVKATPRLPAVKRRQDENAFWAAHRVLNKVLRLSENLVVFNHEHVELIEEETQSNSYAGLPTIYRRCIISGTLVEDAV